MKIENKNRSLMLHGMLLFLFGLLIGLAEQRFKNIRMALAAHLEGLMNGIFLLVLGAIWAEIRVSPRTKAIAYWTVLYGTYGNWAITTFAAIVGASSLSPLTGSGRSAAPWQETVVTFGFLSVGIAMIASSVISVWGLRRAATP